MSDLALSLVCLCGVVSLAVLYIYRVEAPLSRRLLASVRIVAHSRVCTPEGEPEEPEPTEPSPEPVFDVTEEEIEVETASQDGASLRSGVAEVLQLREEPNSHAHSHSQAEQRPLFLIIPGNPGLVGFYRLFMLYMHRLCKGQVEFRCVSFVGHTAASLNGGRKFSFQFQLGFFKAYLQRLIKQHPGRKIFLAGHSVGAYVCLQLLASLSEEQKPIVPQTFMLFPPVYDIALTPNGLTHTPVLKYLRPLVLGILGLLSVLPRTIKDYILFKHIGLHPYEVEAARSVLQVHTVSNCLYMAAHEMAEIGPLQESLIRRHLPSLYWIWSHTDQWAPMYQLDVLKRTFGSRLRYAMADRTVKHAFVVGGAHLVAPMVHAQLKQFLGGTSTPCRDTHDTTPLPSSPTPPAVRRSPRHRSVAPLLDRSD